MDGIRDNLLTTGEINRLKRRIDDLRISRRVLLSLLERIEHERAQLVIQNQKLQKNNSQYAREIFKKNVEILELQSHIREKSSSK